MPRSNESTKEVLSQCVFVRVKINTSVYDLYDRRSPCPILYSLLITSTDIRYPDRVSAIVAKLGTAWVKPGGEREWEGEICG